MTVAALTRNPVDNAKPTTDALKIATDRILKQQALTLQTAAGYRLKLDEASSYVARLEQAYMKIVANNSGLKGKITTDQQTINKVTAQVDAQQLKMDDLTITVAQLQNELKNVATHRQQLVQRQEESALAVQTLSTSLATMKSEAEGLLKQLSQAQHHSSQLEAQLKATQDEMETLSKAFDEQSVQIEDLTSALAAKELVHQSLKKIHEEALEENSAQLTTLQSTLAAADAERSQLAESIGALEKSLNETTQEATAANAKVETLQKELDEVRVTAAATLEATKKEADARHSDAMRKLKDDHQNALETQREQSRLGILAIEQKHKCELAKQVDQLLEEKNLETTTLTTTLREKDSSLAEMKEKATALEQQLSTARKEAEFQAATHQKRTKELEATQAKLLSFTQAKTNPPPAPVGHGKRPRHDTNTTTAAEAPSIPTAVHEEPSPAPNPARALNMDIAAAAAAAPPITAAPTHFHQQPSYFTSHDILPETEAQDDLMAEHYYDEGEEEEDDHHGDCGVITTAHAAAAAPLNKRVHLQPTPVDAGSSEDDEEAAYGQVQQKTFRRKNSPAVPIIKKSNKSGRNQLAAMKPPMPPHRVNGGGGGGSRPHSRLAAMRPSESASHRSNGSFVGKKIGALGGGVRKKKNGCANQTDNQPHQLFQLFGGLSRASPGQW